MFRIGGIGPPVMLLGVLVLLHLCVMSIGEPFKNGDETRHVMTGVFVRDALADWHTSTADPREYAVKYYVQYPALGIIIWPPFFYGVEGIAMWGFGTSYLVARVVLYIFAILAGVYAYRLFRFTHGSTTALIASAAFGLAPLVFNYTDYVLLEIPALALVLGSIYHFEKYLKDTRSKDALLACLLAALAALTRFDAVILLPFVLFRLGFARQFGALLRRPVIVGVLLALLLTVPYYLFTWRVYGAGIQHAATSGASAAATSWLDVRNFYLYPSFIPEQIGWTGTVAAAFGMICCLWRDRSGCGVYAALLTATYLTLVPLAEPDARHAIYWVPALVLFAARGIVIAFGAHVRAMVVVVILLICCLAFETIGPLRKNGWSTDYLTGTDEAASQVLAKWSGELPIMYDGQLNGAFIYAIRRRDPQRRATVLRGDKILYSVYCDPTGGYEEYAKSDREVMELIHRYDPEYIIVEDPEVFIQTPAGSRLRHVLREHPADYKLDDVIPFRTTMDSFAASRLLVYRKLIRNPVRIPVSSLPVMAIQNTVTVK